VVGGMGSDPGAGQDVALDGLEHVEEAAGGGAAAGAVLGILGQVLAPSARVRLAAPVPCPLRALVEPSRPFHRHLPHRTR
jgi:hypothetical protein